MPGTVIVPNPPRGAGSDARYPFEVGRTFTRLEATELTPEAVVATIRDGGVEVHVRDTCIDELVRTRYRYVHRYL